MAEVNKKVGKNLAKARLDSKLTIDDISYHSGVSRSSIYRIERGLLDSRISTIKRLADVLKVDMEKLFKGI